MRILCRELLALIPPCLLGTAACQGHRDPGSFEVGSPRDHQKAWGLADGREVRKVLEQWRVIKCPCLSSYSSNCRVPAVRKPWRQQLKS